MAPLAPPLGALPLPGGAMRITRHRHIMLALVRQQGGVLTIAKDARAMRAVRLVLGRIAEQRQGVEVTQEDACAQKLCLWCRLGASRCDHEEEAMQRYMRGPGGIVGVLVVFVVIFLLLRLLGLV